MKWLFLYVYVFYLGFLMYASVMNAGFKNLPLFVKALLVPPGIVFLLMDVLFNITLGTILFFQLPTKATITLSKRMSSNIATGSGWRFKLSSLIVNNLLLPFTKQY